MSDVMTVDVLRADGRHDVASEVGKSLWWWSDLAKISLACSAVKLVT